ncbi:hypothetical protein ALP37_102351 [Pseudomonas amygdali pv. sesami]|nr:hypothetical protein ALO93_102507 [Pseudomonas amygdali pv. sesami]RMU05771.1 hypothetical protein ALP37_102351 [Pseudomonas amygdali pv. sesami]
MQQPQRFALQDCMLGQQRLVAGTLETGGGERIDFRVQAFNPLDTGVEQFHWRDLFAADQRTQFGGGFAKELGWVLHGVFSQMSSFRTLRVGMHFVTLCVTHLRRASFSRSGARWQSLQPSPNASIVATSAWPLGTRVSSSRYSRSVCTLPPTGPRPHRVGIPRLAVKPESAQPPVNSPSTLKPSSCARP